MATEEARIAILLEQVEKTVGGFSKIERAVESLEKELKDLRNAGRIDTATFDRAREKLKRVSAAAKKARRDLANVGKAKSSIAGLTSAISGLRSVLAVLGIAAVVRRMTDLVKAAIDVKNAFDSIENTLRAVTDTTEQFADAQRLVFTTSKRLGLSIVAVGKDYAQLVAATKELDLSQRQVEEVFVAVAEAGRVLNLSQQRIQLTFLALSQIASKGILTLEELRRQLGDQIPGIVPAVAKAMGETTASFLSMVKAGDILSEQALPAIKKALVDLAGSEVQAASQTLAANIGRLKLEVELLQKRVIETNDKALKGFLQNLADIAASSPQTERELSAMVKQLISLGEVAADVGPVAVAALRSILDVVVLAAKGTSFLKRVFEDVLKLGIRIANLDLSLEFDSEGVRLGLEETADAIDLVNERLLEAQGKNAKEAKKIAQEAADQRVKIVDLMVAKIEREEQELGLTLEEIAKKREKFIQDLAKVSASERRTLLSNLLKGEVQLEIEAARDRADAFEDLTDQARENADERIRNSEVVAEKLVQLEIETTEQLAGVLDQALDKTRLTGEQRLEAQTELAEKLVLLEAETADKIEAIRQEFEDSIREGTSREDAEKEASEKVLKVYEDELKKRLDLTKKAADAVIKLEEKRVETVAKLEKKLTEKILKEIEIRRKAFIELNKLFDDLAKGFEGPATGDAAAEKRIAEINKKLTDLGSLGFDEIGNLNSELIELMANLGSTDASFDALGESAKAATSLMNQIDTEGFRSQLAGLTQAQQITVDALLQGFAETARAGGVNQQVISELRGEFTDLGLTAGQSLGAAGTAADNLTAAIDRLSTGAKNSDEIVALRAKLAELTGSAQQAAVPMKEVADAAGEIAQQAPAAAEGAARLVGALADDEGAVSSAASSFDQLANALPPIQDSVSDLSSTIPGLLESLKTAAEDGTLDTVAASILKLSEGIKKDELEVLIAALTAIVEAGENRSEVDALADALAKLAAEDVVSRMGELATKLDAAATGLESIKTSADGVDTAVEAARDALQELLDFMETSLLPGLEKTATGLGQVVTELDRTRAAAEDVADAFEGVISKSSEMASSLVSDQNEIQAANARTVASIQEIIDKLSELDQKRDDVT